MALNSNSLPCRRRRQLYSWNPSFPGKTARVAGPQDHLTSLEDSNNIQKMVVGEGLGTMGSQAENKETAYNLWGFVWTGKETPDKGLQANCENSIKSSEGVLTSEGWQCIGRVGVLAPISVNLPGYNVQHNMKAACYGKGTGKIQWNVCEHNFWFSFYFIVLRWSLYLALAVLELNM